VGANFHTFVKPDGARFAGRPTWAMITAIPVYEDNGMTEEPPVVMDAAALYRAAAHGSAQDVRNLIMGGTPADAVFIAKDGLQLNALHGAASNGNLGAVQMLLAHGASVEGTVADGPTPLFLAASGSNPAIVAALLEHGADPHAGAGRGEITPLTSAYMTALAHAHRWPPATNPIMLAFADHAQAGRPRRVIPAEPADPSRRR
jgi:uncharacterized protein